MKKLLIVGFDPGTTSALAIVDTNKNILLLKSKREMDKKEILETITKHGRPIIVAGDRFPLPKAVEKLASSLGCKPFTSGESLTNIEKYKLISNYIEETKNSHERDALASAFKAYEKYSKLFKKADKILSHLGLNGSYDRVVEMVILERADNITDGINIVLNEIREKKEKLVEKKVESLEKITKKDVMKLHREIRQKENDISILKNYNEILKKRLKRVQNIIEEERKKSKKKIDSDQFDGLKKSVDVLEKRLREKDEIIGILKNFRNIEIQGYAPIIEVNGLSPGRIQELNKTMGVKDRILLTKDTGNIQILNDYNIKCLVTETILNKKILEKVNFPVILEKDISIKKINGILSVKEKELEQKLSDARKRGFVEWVKGHKKRKL